MVFNVLMRGSEGAGSALFALMSSDREAARAESGRASGRIFKGDCALEQAPQGCGHSTEPV